jgi:hypothetical protein
MKCSRCNGTGLMFNNRENSKTLELSICKHCKGKQDIDWLDNIFGIENCDLSADQIIRILNMRK